MKNKFDKIYEQTMYGELITEEKMLLAEGKITDIVKSLSNKIKKLLSGDDEKVSEIIANQVIAKKLNQIKPTEKSKQAINRLYKGMEKSVPELLKKIDPSGEIMSRVVDELENKNDFDKIRQDAYKELKDVIWELDPSTNTYMRTT